MRLLAVLICASAYGQTVEGSVVNSVTGAPIPGVAVRIELQGKPSQEVASDATGAFRVDTLPEGRFTLSFSKHGFLPPPPNTEARQPFTVRTGAANVRVTAKMIPLGRVTGRVLDGDENPIPDAGVELFRSTFNGETGSSGKDGSFRFEQVPPGTYTLSARPPKENENTTPSPSRSSTGWPSSFWQASAIRAS